MIEDLITNQLTNFGVLGLWTLSLLYKNFISDKKRDDKLTSIIENNTTAVTRVYEVLKSCHSKKTTKI